MKGDTLTIEKQNEFALKANMIIEIENNLLVFVNDPNFPNKDKLSEYQVQVVFNYQELEKYAKALENYKDNEKVKEFFDNYFKFKDRLTETVNRISNKEILKKVKAFREEIQTKVEEQEMNNLIKELSEQYGVDESELKIVSMRKPKNKGVSLFLEFGLSYLFNIVLLFSFSGLIKWGDWNGNLISLLLFVVYYSTIDIVLRLLSSKYLSKYIFKTFGLVLVLPLIVTTIITSVFPIFIKMESIFLFILTSVLVYVIRRFVYGYIMEKVFSRKKVKKNER